VPTFQEFTEIASHYDRLMASVPYTLWADYVEQILRRLKAKPRRVLDIACGTGNTSEPMYDRGCQVTGVDVSPEMIEIARSKAARSGRQIEYDVQDIADLSLNRRFDLAISLFDSLNYVTDPERLARGIARVFEHLDPGGLFIFDVNTEYALAQHFFDQSSLDIGRYPRYIWTSEYDRETRICRVEMVFEVMENGVKRQFTEEHLQRAYSTEELRTMLENAGFEVANVFRAYTFRKPARRTDRLFYVARRGA